MVSRGSSFVFLLLLPASVIGCGGYSYKLMNLKTLEDNDLLKFEDSDITIDNNCEMEIKGCISIEHDIDNFTLTYNLTINDNQIENSRNGCETFEMFSLFPQLASSIKRFKLPEQCPVRKGKYCLYTKYNITKYQGTLGMFAGDNICTVKLLTSTNHIGHYQYHASLSKMDT